MLSNSDANANWLSPFVCSTNRFVLIFPLSWLSFFFVALVLIHIRDFVCNSYGYIVIWMSPTNWIYVHDLDPFKYSIDITKRVHLCEMCNSKLFKCYYNVRDASVKLWKHPLVHALSMKLPSFFHSTKKGELSSPPFFRSTQILSIFVFPVRSNTEISCFVLCLIFALCAECHEVDDGKT